MPRQNRSDVFDPDTVGVYHCFNRTVRRSFLCGQDPVTGADYSHRREWLYQRLKYLSQSFAVDVLGYAILSNHYHLVLRNRPDIVATWDDRTVATRWLMICPDSQRKLDGTAMPPTEAELNAELNTPGRIAELRKRLSDPSWMIRLASQHVGSRCNAEDGVTGHFWEGRYKMIRLEDEAAVLACMAYVDLNPLRAGLACTLDDYPYVSIGERMRTLEENAIDTSKWLAPLELSNEVNRQPVIAVNDLSREELEQALSEDASPLGCVPMELAQYQELLKWLASSRSTPASKEPCGAEKAHEAPSMLAQCGVPQESLCEWVSYFSVRYSAFTQPSCPHADKSRPRGIARVISPADRARRRFRRRTTHTTP